MRCPPALRLAAAAASLAWSCVAGAAAYPNTEGFGVAFAKDEDWYRHCMRALQAALPSAPPRPAPMRCNATDLYYLKRDRQHSSAAEWHQVRDCAEGSGDDAVLMMLYANGYGVVRDTDRAIYHACRLDAAKAEMELRVGYLAGAASASDEHPFAHPFDLCDHITSGRMGGSSTVTRAHVRSTEHVWLAYRDAWEPFLAAAGLPTDFTSVKAVLTRQRIAQLKRIYR